jgi:CRP-like cAMP-binding protein
VKRANAILADSALFKNLSPIQVDKVIGISKETRFPKDSLIMSEGEDGESMYVILSGTVEVIKKLTIDGLDDDGLDRNKTFTTLNAESNDAVFGEIALLEKSKRTATVRSLTDCTLYEIKKADFLQLAETDYQLGYQVLKNLASIVSSRLRKANEDILKLTSVLSLILKE